MKTKSTILTPEEWKFGMQLCGECGTCRYVCPVDAIEWSYPEAGTGVVLKYS